MLKTFNEEYEELLKSTKFITYRMYNDFLNNHQEYIKNNLNDLNIREILNHGYKRVEEHNEHYINQKLIEHQSYFDNLMQDIDPSIKLDTEQRRAIVNEEDYSLIIAGAGAGKTTTMAAKVKYLIEKCYINPKNIAVISYTNKATNELEDRIKYGFKLPVDIMTFHSLGIKIVRKLFSNPLNPITENEQKKIITDYIKKVLFPNKKLLTKYIKTFNKYAYKSGKMFSCGFVQNYQKFSTFEEYFTDYKKRKLAENYPNLENIIAYRTENYLKFPEPRTLKNETMRSLAEAKIANFLFTHGIDYLYEEPYPEKVDEEERSMRPDFTIQVNGIPLYIEYFGLSTFYENNRISPKDQLKYDDIRKKKRAFHALNHNNYIELDYQKIEGQTTIDYLKDLENALLSHGVPLHKISPEAIYNQLLDNNIEAEFYRFNQFMLELISNIKTHPAREKYHEIITNHIAKLDVLPSEKSEMLTEIQLFSELYTYYESKLLPKNRIDFSDMIYYANKNMQNIKDLLNYEYIIIDEYQDISLDRYEFARKLSILSQGKVTSVGDDWQTIFSFAGSRIDLFLKYSELFPGAKNLFINHTYRSSKELIDIAGNFIMKNPSQIKKNLESDKRENQPLKFYPYQDNEYDILNYLITKIHHDTPSHNILILARKNKHIKKMFETPYFEEGIGTKVICKAAPNCNIEAMSVHSAKGLGADEVIILHVTNTDFPCPEKETIWLSGIFKPHGANEHFPYAEDRRIFYVALTRTKNNVYLLIPKNESERSPFLKELIITK